MPDDAAAVMSRIRRAHRDGDTPELGRAVRQLADLTDLETAPVGRVAALGAACYQLFEQTGEPATLLAARQAYEAALARPGEHPPIWRSHLGMCLVRESERTGRLEPLTEALPLLRSAAADLPGLLAAHANLGLGLLRAIERTADATLLPEALAAARVAGAAAVRLPASRARILSNTCNTLMAAWEVTGKPDHLEAAVEAGRAARALVPAGGAAVPGCAAALARALLARSAVTGDPGPAAEAVRHLSRSLRAVAPGDPDRPIYLNQLAIAHRVTFARTGDVAALDEAIRVWAGAVRLLPPDHPDRAAYRLNRAGALRNRFETVADAAALDEAVRELEDVVAATEAGDPERPARLAGLANALHRKGVAAGEPQVLARAAELLRAAAAQVPTDQPEHRAHRANLGSVLLAGARVAPGDSLDETIAVLTEALAGTGPDDPELAGALLNLGHAGMLRWERTGVPGDLAAAAGAYDRLLATPSATALSRATAAYHLGLLRVRTREWPAARESLSRAVELLDLVAWAGLGRDDQERLLVGFPALATTAAACALELGDPGGAVEILEQGRGVLYAQALSRWAGVDEVRGTAPELAERLGAVHDLLEASTRAEQDSASDRHRAALHREAVIEEIRGTPGLKGFLRPPPIGDLCARLGGRTVVIVNVAAHRCDALLLTGAGTQHVPLPGLAAEDVARYAAAALRPTDDDLLDILAWLWDTVAGPVLDRLGTAGPVWWTPTGALSFLPLHAAGHHRPGDGTARSAPHRVVSSYAPTVRSLIATAPPPAPELAVVVAPGVRARPGLPAASREADHVRRRLGSGAVMVSGPDATTTRVRDLLADADWAHFAGHATADPARPSDSHLALHDGPLRVRDLLRHQARSPRARTLAYLSACSTVQGGARLPDENIHLASALRLAGFADVVATSWPVPDMVAVRAAELIYAGLETGRPAHAVNAATRELRERYPQRPSLWASHVHVGAGHEVMMPTG